MSGVMALSLSMNCAWQRCQKVAEVAEAVAVATGDHRELGLCADHRDGLKSGSWVLDLDSVDPLRDEPWRPAPVVAESADLRAGDFRQLVGFSQSWSPGMVNGRRAEVVNLELAFLDGERDRAVRLVLDAGSAKMLAEIGAALAARLDAENPEQ